MRDNSHGTGYSLAYSYDHNQNRTSKVYNGTTTSYSYDSHDKLLSAGSKSYGYDSNGNCTSVTVGSSVTGLTYDVENRVIGISYPGGATNSFAYNGDDLRVQKVDSTGTQSYVTDGSSPASPVLTDGNAVYTPGLSERRGSTSKFYHGDALGSTRGITDSTQAPTDSILYDAFGNTVSRSGTTPTPFGFVGKEQYQSDSDSGLQLLGHRYYDPSIGRFLSQDPIQDGTNWYAYCDNNPLSITDSEGLEGSIVPPKKGVHPGEKPYPWKVVADPKKPPVTSTTETKYWTEWPLIIVDQYGDAFTGPIKAIGEIVSKQSETKDGKPPHNRKPLPMFPRDSNGDVPPNSKPQPGPGFSDFNGGIKPGKGGSSYPEHQWWYIQNDRSAWIPMNDPRPHIITPTDLGEERTFPK